MTIYAVKYFSKYVKGKDLKEIVAMENPVPNNLRKSGKLLCRNARGMKKETIRNKSR